MAGAAAVVDGEVESEVIKKKHGRRLYDLVESGKIDEVKRLIKLYGEELDIDYTSNDGYKFTPLLASVSIHDIDMVNVLLDAGADPNCTDNKHDRYSPLHWAASVQGHDYASLSIGQTKERIEIVTALLEAGANVNAVTVVHKMTPLAFAVSNGFDKITQILLSYDADTTIKPYDGRAVLDIAMDNCRQYTGRNRPIYFGDTDAIVGMLEQHAPPSQFVKSANKR